MGPPVWACVLFLCILGRLEAEAVPFALYDLDGNTTFGRLLDLTSEKVVLQTDADEKKEFATKEVAKLENLLRNPFASADTTPEQSALPITTMDRWGQRIRVVHPTPPPQQSSRAVASLLQRKEAEAKANDGKSEFPSSIAVVEMTDGSRFLATELTAKGKTATFQLFPEGELTQPLDHLIAARLAVGTPALAVDPPTDWTKLLTQPSTKGDRLVVGTAGSLDAHEGILNELGAGTIRFTVGNDTLPVPRRKVFGLIFHQPEQPKASRPLCRVLCWNGTFLVLNSLEFKPPHLNPLPREERPENDPSEGEETVVWTTLGGAEGTFRLEDIAEIVFETTGAVSLNALTPSYVEQALPFVWEKKEIAETSPLALFQRFQTNRLRQEAEMPPQDPILQQILNRRLPGDTRSAKIAELPIPDFQGIELEGTIYRQGLVVPAKTTLVFPLKESYQAFTAKIGIDDRIRPDGQVRLTVLGGEQLLLDTIVYGDEPTKAIHLGIENCRTLTICVDFAHSDAKAAVLSLVELQLVE